MSSVSPTELSQQFRDTIARARKRIVPKQSVRLILLRQFTASERARVGDEPTARQVIDAYASLRKCSVQHAIIDCAEGIDLLTAATAGWLRRELDGTSPPTEGSSVPTIKPVWNSATGELRFRGKLARQVRICKTPTQCYRVCEAFHQAGWISVITNPFGSGLRVPGASQITNVCNKGLEFLRFHAQAGGRQLRWEALKVK